MKIKINFIYNKLIIISRKNNVAAFHLIKLIINFFKYKI